MKTVKELFSRPILMIWIGILVAVAPASRAQDRARSGFWSDIALIDAARSITFGPTFGPGRIASCWFAGLPIVTIVGSYDEIDEFLNSQDSRLGYLHDLTSERRFNIGLVIVRDDYEMKRVPTPFLIRCQAAVQASFVGQATRTRVLHGPNEVSKSGPTAWFHGSSGNELGSITLDELSRDWVMSMLAEDQQRGFAWDEVVQNFIGKSALTTPCILHIAGSGEADEISQIVQDYAETYRDRGVEFCAVSQSEFVSRNRVSSTESELTSVRACEEASLRRDIDELARDASKSWTIVLGGRPGSQIAVQWDAVKQARRQILEFLQKNVAQWRVELTFQRIDAGEYSRARQRDDGWRPVANMVFQAEGANYVLRDAPPDLVWSDLQALMFFAPDKSKINKDFYQRSSSYDVAWELERGSVALWLVDSVRNNRYFHTDHILIGYNSDPDMDMRVQAYLRWWDKVQGLSREDATKVCPRDMGFKFIDWTSR